ncbi:hypothetical protein IID22_03640 [Patescibacteria group bacterium]|nr:hypothetical protein [Patescibacteria group bacterium]
MKKFSKKKAGPRKGPKYRTPDHFSPRKSYGETGSPRKNYGEAGSSRFGRDEAGKGSKFSGKGQVPSPKFSPGTFKVQHKG